MIYHRKIERYQSGLINNIMSQEQARGTKAENKQSFNAYK
jgi:hypothetical protein